MPKSLRKVLSLVIVLLLALSSLYGCGNSNKTAEMNETAKSNTTQTTAVQPQVTAESDPLSKYAPIDGKKYSITWCVSAYGPINEDAELIKYWNDRFNVDIKVEGIDSNSFAEKVNLKIASGDIPDVYRANTLSTYNKFIQQDVVAEIPMDVVQKFAPGFYKDVTSLNEDCFNYLKVDGKNYGLPNMNSQYQFRQPIVWRDDWLKNVGITKVPETLAEVEDAFYKFRNGDPDKNGKKDTYALSWNGLTSIFGAYGSVPDFSMEIKKQKPIWTEKDGKLIYNGIRPEVKEALALMAKWYKDEIIDPEFITGENKGGYWAISNSFVTGRIGYTGMGYYYHWAPAEVNAGLLGQDLGELAKALPDAKTVYGAPPTGPAGLKGTAQDQLMQGNTMVLGSHMADEPDKIGKVLEIINTIMSGTVEDYLTARMGIKDKHWKMSEAGAPVNIPPYNDISELQKVGSHTILCLGKLKNDDESLSAPLYKFARENNMDKDGVANQLMVALPSDGKYKAELEKMRIEAYIGIITGDKPVGYFDEFVSSWKAAGGDQLTKEANDWWQSIK